MRACVADLRRALAVSAEEPALLELAARSVDGELAGGFDAHAAGPG
jgi:hypothetical protein